MSLKIVFMGTPDFAVPALKTLKKNMIIKKLLKNKPDRIVV